MLRLTVVPFGRRAVTGSSPVRKHPQRQRQVVQNKHDFVAALKKMLRKGDSSIEEATEMLANLGLGSKPDTQLEQLLRKLQSVDLNEGPTTTPDSASSDDMHRSDSPSRSQEPFDHTELPPSSQLGFAAPRELSWLEQEDELERQMNICVAPYGCRVAVTKSSSNHAEMEDNRASTAIIGLYEKLVRLWDNFGMAPKVTFETVWLRADMQGEVCDFFLALL